MNLLHDSLFSAIGAFLLSLYVFLRNPRDSRNLTFSGFLFTCAVLSLGCYLVYNSANTSNATLTGSITRPFFVFLPAFLLAFCFSFADFKGRKARAMVYTGFVLSALWAALSFTPLMVRDFVRVGPYFKPVYGPIYYMFVGHIALSALLGVGAVLRRYRKTNAYHRNRIRMFLLGLSLGLAMGCLGFLLADKVDYPLVTIGIFVSMPIMAASFLGSRLWGLSSYTRMALGWSILSLIILLPFYALMVLAVVFFQGQASHGLLVSLAVLLFLALLTVPDLKRWMFRSLSAMTASRRAVRGEDLLAGAADLVGRGSLDQLGSKLARLLRDHTRASHVSVYIGGLEADLLLMGYQGKNMGRVPSRAARDGSMTWLLEQGRVFLQQDLPLHDHAPAAAQLVRTMDEWGADLLIPVRTSELASAVIAMGPPDDGLIYEPKDISFLEKFSDVASLALSSTMRFKEEETANQVDHVSRWVASLAHELRNSLLPARTFLELLPERQDDDEFKDSYRRLALDRLGISLKLVAQLRELVVDAPPRLDECKLDELLRETILSFQYEAQQAEIALKFRAPRQTIRSSVDRDQITQVFSNILQNAIRHAEGEPVLIEASLVNTWGDRHRAWAVVTINNKAQIQREQQRNIFTPFYRGLGSPGQEKGFGLGLSISRKIIHAHGGRLSVRSSPAEGTTFIVALPALKEPGAVEPEPRDIPAVYSSAIVGEATS